MRRTRPAIMAILVATSMLVAAPSAAAASNWSDSYPTTGNVTMPAGETVTLDTDLTLTGLQIDGTVRCGDQSVKIKARWILVNGDFR